MTELLEQIDSSVESKGVKHFVYLYRDMNGKPLYVGYGAECGRATAQHRETLENFLSKHKHTIEIAGPFEKESIARSVETTLISSMEPEFNEDQGPTQWRFRPLGIPENLAERQLQVLRIEDLLRMSNGKSILFVTVQVRDFKDGRIGFKPHDPDDTEICNQIVHSWQIGKLVSEWSSTPSSSADILVGVHGKPGKQMVVGALKIASDGWKEATPGKQQLYAVPVKSPDDLDAGGLRGCRIDRSVGIKFGPNRSEFFMVLKSDGIAIGGRSNKRA